MADLAKYQDIGDTLPFVPRILSRYDISYCYIVIYTDYCFVLLFHNLPPLAHSIWEKWKNLARRGRCVFAHRNI